MLHAPRTEHTKKSRAKRVRFPRITAHARALGVNRATLYKMLAGYAGFAELKGLRARYRALVAAEATARKERAA